MTNKYRNLTLDEISNLERQNCTATEWGNVMVKDGFSTNFLRDVQFGGKVLLGANGGKIHCEGAITRPAGIYKASIYNTSIDDNVLISNIGRNITNYDIHKDVRIENVGEIICTSLSSFGVGTQVASINEGGGREIPIYNELTAQIAYILAMYRHRYEALKKIEEMLARDTEAAKESRGTIKCGATIINTLSIIDTVVGAYAIVDGAASLRNGTVNSTYESPSFIGNGVRASDFIVARSARVDTGAVVRHCFVGEGAIIENNYSAEHSLFFANSHCALGEACALFGGPFTVSHHRSTLLIAGYVSFFNAGSGANQSNHMYKTGPVHQGIHLRGCKFGSDAYIMLPARTGVFTVVTGRHYSHHDTDLMPFSYLVENDGESLLAPAVNLRSYGTARDVKKWPNRDKRVGVSSDRITYDLLSPYTISKVLKAITLCNSLLESNSLSDSVKWNRVKIRSAMLRKGIQIYTQAVTSFLATIYDSNKNISPYDPKMEEWVDLAGMIVAKSHIDKLLDEIESEKYSTIAQIEEQISKLHNEYEKDCRTWGTIAAAEILGKNPEELTEQDIEGLVERGRKDIESLNNAVTSDAQKDSAAVMRIGYGIDGDNDDRDIDFNAVRGE